ncbi:MAG: dockerin type I domain-containing protein [bacterium]
MDFTCGVDTQETITLLPGYQVTDVTDLSGFTFIQTSHESLAIFCGNPPTATPTATRTPGGATDTPTPLPTDTPTPLATNTPLYTNTPTITPTRTPRRNNVLLGDVDGDLNVNSLDALWVLWFSAGIVIDVPLPDAADVNGDDIVNATDALYVLWVEANEIILL